MGFAGGAGGPPVEDAAVAEVVGLLRWKELPQGKLHLLRVLCLDEADPVGDPDKVGVRDYCAGHPVYIARNEVCGLPADPLQRGQFFDGGGDFPVEPFQYLVCHDDEVPGFCVEEARGADEFLHVLHVGLCHGFRGRVLREQRRSHQVYPGLGALGGQSYRHQQLVGVYIGQRSNVVRKLFFQKFHTGNGPFLFRHKSISQVKYKIR